MRTRPALESVPFPSELTALGLLSAIVWTTIKFLAPRLTRVLDQNAARVARAEEELAARLERLEAEITALRERELRHVAEIARLEGERNARARDAELLRTRLEDCTSARELLERGVAEDAGPKGPPTDPQEGNSTK